MIATLLLFIGVPAFAQTPQELRQGAYMARLSGCADCHTVSPDRPMAGGLPLVTPFGTFYTPNITRDMETGIGSWSVQDFVRALRDGRSPEGKIYYPSFPYRSFTKLSDQDLHDIFFYLKALTPIRQKNRAHRLKFPFAWRAPLLFWQLLFLQGSNISQEQNIKIGPGPFVPDYKQTDAWNRGAYLVEAAMHCTECHTPRNLLGAPELELWMSGSSLSVGGRFPINITPDMDTGLGRWSREDWNRFLASGFTPQNRSPGGEMAQVVQNTSALSKEDRSAVIDYLMSLKAIRSSESAQ